MIISYTSAGILVRLNNMNTDISMSNACILVRLNNINNDIGSWGVHLSFIEGGGIADGGDTIASEKSPVRVGDVSECVKKGKGKRKKVIS